MITIIAEPNYAREAILQYEKFGTVYHWFSLSKAEQKKVAERAEILIVRLAVTVNRDFLEAMPRLKIIGTSTTGMNHIDVDYAKKKGIRIVSLRGETSFLRNISSTAEETMALILALMRHIPWAFDDVKEGKWEPNRWTGNELKGKTLGIIGLGRLGKLVAGYARAFGITVIATDPNVSEATMARHGAKKVNLNTLLKKSDIVSLHVLLTEKTKGILGARHFKEMKKDAFFVNTSRAELLESGALYSALMKKNIAGAAIDVLDNEVSDASHLKNNPLVAYARKNKNLLIVPHIGGTTYEAKIATQNHLAKLVTRLLRKS